MTELPRHSVSVTGVCSVTTGESWPSSDAITAAGAARRRAGTGRDTIGRRG